MQRLIATAIVILSLAAVPAAADEFDLAKLKEGGYVVLLRHVTAGGSDSDDFDLKDCSTQRQVGPSGRSEAEAVAARFKAAGITAARVLSSQWCRALQTAALLGLGPVVEEPALNYYHWRLGDEAAMNEALRAYFVALEAPPPGAPLVLVAHTTAFKAIGVEAPKAGGGVVLRPNGTNRPEIVGKIAAPE